jgi:hypothetical protein
MRNYFEVIGAWLKGLFVWLWTRHAVYTSEGTLRWADRSPQKRDPRRPLAPRPETCITYKPKWGLLKFPRMYLLVYFFNVGTHVWLTGGAVKTWSRAFWDWRKGGSRVAKLVDRLLQKALGDDHGELSAEALWGTRPCSPGVRIVVVLFWPTLVAGVWWYATR